MTTTLREQLTEAGFDWSPHATIIVQRYRDPHAHSPSFYDGVFVEGHWYTLGWCHASDVENVTIPHDHPILDQPFDDGFGSPQMPRFWCKTPQYIYFPGTYDGSTWVSRVALYPGMYLGKDAESLPYVGGG